MPSPADVPPRRRAADELRQNGRAYIEATIRDRTFSLVYQPIVHLDSGTLSGLEALCRFDDGRPPDMWFDQCEELGLAVFMDFAVIETAITQVDALPPEGYLSLNLSASTLSHAERLRDLLLPVLATRRVVLELTEHAVVDDYDRVAAAVRLLRDAGIRFAVDDAGAGHSTFRHILQLRPDIIKLDRSITQSIDEDEARLALTSALVVFAAEVSASVVAEGIETEAELVALRSAGVSRGQGYWLARPGPLPIEPLDYQPLPYIDIVGTPLTLAGRGTAEAARHLAEATDATVAVLAHNALVSMASITGAIELLRASDRELPLDEYRALCSMMQRRATYVSTVLKEFVRGLPPDAISG